jgi:hypothetical protein
VTDTLDREPWFLRLEIYIGALIGAIALLAGVRLGMAWQHSIDRDHAEARAAHAQAEALQRGYEQALCVGGFKVRGEHP